MRVDARLPADEFFARYRSVIEQRRIRIGCSFAPELVEADAHDPALALSALRTAVSDYGIRDVRLGLRWNTIASEADAITRAYEPFVDYCFNEPGVRHLCLDIGPIKTFRWPEVHVPARVLDSLADRPPGGAVIDAGDEIAQRAFAHFERVLADLGQRYGGVKPVSFAFNEPFNPFGPLRWTMSETYLTTLVDLVAQSGYFPDGGYVVNSSEGRDLDRIASWFETLISRDPSIASRLTTGYDLYPFVPAPVGARFAMRALHALRGSRWAAAERSIARAQRVGYRIEVTEAQAEPWGREQTVGNSLAHYQHVLAESIHHILNPEQDESVIRMWGIEYQLGRLLRRSATEANREIMRLTAEINALTE